MKKNSGLPNLKYYKMGVVEEYGGAGRRSPPFPLLIQSLLSMGFHKIINSLINYLVLVKIYLAITQIL